MSVRTAADGVRQRREPFELCVEADTHKRNLVRLQNLVSSES